MMDPSPHQYQLLPQGNYIRILHIDNSVNEIQPICTFETIQLDTGPQKYIAISYTWGDSTPVRHLACSDGQSLGVSDTISSLLDALLKKESSVTIFIDALCINQGDLNEKANQVALMGSVYSKARMVIVWLGPSDIQTQKAFLYLREGTFHDIMSSKDTQMLAAKSMDSEAAPTKDGEVLRVMAVVYAFMALLRRRWFQRVWIIQEVILGANVLVACGDDMILFETFKVAIMALWDCTESVDFIDIRHPSYLGFRCATKLFELQNEFDQHGKLSLEALFETAFFFSATDSRDFVFAIRGIADRLHLLPGPDYTASIETVFTDTAENLCCKGTSLDGLALCGLGPRVQASNFLEFCNQPPHNFEVSLPSWVPDFRQLAYDEPLLACNKGDWNAGGPLGLAPSRSAEGLHVRAIVLDKVVRVGYQIYTLTRRGLYISLRRAISIAGADMKTLTADHPKFDMIWRTLVMDLDMNELPATAELGLAFADLIQTLTSGRGWEDIKKNQLFRILRVRTDSWSTFVSDNGAYGVTWPIVEENDYICLLPGCRFPLIIRPTDKDCAFPSESPRGSLIGWCYVQGIMYGEEIHGQNLEEVVLM